VKQFRFLFLLFFSFFSSAVSAQILNDSTQSVYSPVTTRTFLENDFLRGNYETRVIDTTLNNLNRTRNWFHDTTFHQDLGNIGTAAKPLQWRYPTRIGARLGKNVFDRYNYDPYNVTYFDTKSPYTHLFYVQGGQGEQVFEAKHVRSYKELASFGLAFQRISAEKQIGVGSQDAGQVDNLAFNFFTHVQNKSGKYHLFSNYSISRHEVIESGGIKVTTDLGKNNEDSLYRYKDAPVWLYGATNLERRNNFHFTQFYTLAKEYIKLFHTTDFRRQTNVYSDSQLQLRQVDSVTTIPSFYPRVLIDAGQTQDSTVYKEWEHTVGITGNHPLFFYKLYAKNRNVNVLFTEQTPYKTPIETPSTFVPYQQKINQNFIGGETQFKLRDIFNITLNAEYQLFRDYYAQASARVKFFTFSQSRTSYSPSLMQQVYTSNHYKWDNDFDNIVADRTTAGINVNIFHNSIQAEVARINLQNYVVYALNPDRNKYARNDYLPQQLSNQLAFYTATLHHHLKLRSLNLDHVFVYNELSNAKEIRMPAWMVNSKIYYEGFLFKKALFGQAGIETYINDNYYADTYNPALQQFVLQDDFEVKKYPVVDVFITADIKSFNLFLKYAHINQGYPAQGYITTPIYSGMPSSFIFGLKWMFFD